MQVSPLGTAIASSDDGFTISRNEAVTSTYERSHEVRASRRVDGVLLYVGPGKSHTLALVNGGNILLSVGEAELVAKELLRVASASPPTE